LSYTWLWCRITVLGVDRDREKRIIPNPYCSVGLFSPLKTTT
jgi:hypothetical protein